MRYILSRYNQDIEWAKKYTDDIVVFDRSEVPLDGSIPVENKGSDIYDKFSYIIDNYGNLPDVARYSKANLPKYISEGEFEKVKDNTTFTPLLTQGHPEIMVDEEILKQQGWTEKKFCYYENGIYYELNYPSYLKHHHLQNPYYEYANTYYKNPLLKLLGIDKMEYIPFAPGSNYILPKENILKLPREFYEELRSYLAWDRYPGENMIIERALNLLWS